MSISADLHERRMAAVARGVSHASTIYAKRAKNAEIWDEDGRRFIDFGSGIAVVNTGHQHPKIVAAIEEQLKAFSHVCFQVTPYESYVRLAERLNAIAPVAGPATREMLLGGTEVGQEALIRFYTLHIAVLPLLITLLVSLHVWRVRKDGGLAANEKDEG